MLLAAERNSQAGAWDGNRNQAYGHLMNQFCLHCRKQLSGSYGGGYVWKHRLRFNAPMCWTRCAKRKRVRAWNFIVGNPLIPPTKFRRRNQTCPKKGFEISKLLRDTVAGRFLNFIPEAVSIPDPADDGCHPDPRHASRAASGFRRRGPALRRAMPDSMSRQESSDVANCGRHAIASGLCLDMWHDPRAYADSSILLRQDREGREHDILALRRAKLLP